MVVLNEILEEKKVLLEILKLEEITLKLQEAKNTIEKKDILNIDEKNLYNRVVTAYERNIFKVNQLAKTHNIKINDLPNVFRNNKINIKNEWYENINNLNEIYENKNLENNYLKERKKKEKSILSEYFNS